MKFASVSSASEAWVILTSSVVSLRGVATLGEHLDRAAGDPAVDFPQQAVFFGDRQEHLRRDDLAVRRTAHAQQRFVVLARFAVQADDRLVVQHEAVAVQRLADALDPRARCALPRRGRTAPGSKISMRLPPTPIDDCTPWLALASTCVTAGDLLADLHAADADRRRQRALADFEHVAVERRAQALGERRRCASWSLFFEQHRELVFAEARGDVVGRQRAAQAGGEPGDADRRRHPGRFPAAASRSGPARSAAGRGARRFARCRRRRTRVAAGTSGG